MDKKCSSESLDQDQFFGVCPSIVLPHTLILDQAQFKILVTIFKSLNSMGVDQES